MDINTGIHDGHTGSVPVSQSLEAFNILANKQDRFTEEDIGHIVRTEKVPAHLAFDGDDPSYGVKIHLRRQSANTRISIFEGGHDAFIGAAFDWLSRQRKGEPTDWNAGSPASATHNDKELSK